MDSIYNEYCLWQLYTAVDNLRESIAGDTALELQCDSIMSQANSLEYLMEERNKYYDEREH